MATKLQQLKDQVENLETRHQISRVDKGPKILVASIMFIEHLQNKSVQKYVSLVVVIGILDLYEVKM